MQRTSLRSLTVHCGVYELVVDNSDRYLDLVTVTVTDWTELMERVRPQGLLGCTHEATAVMPPDEEQHRERANDLLGCDTLSDRHCSARA